MQFTASLLAGIFGAALLLLIALGFAGAPVQQAEAHVPEVCTPGPKERLMAPLTVHFDLDSIKIKSRYRHELDRLAARLHGNPSVRVCFIGQADKSGNADYNKKLALRRAEAVANYMAARGLNPSVFVIGNRGEAFGDFLFSSKPEKADRRVEVFAVEW